MPGDREVVEKRMACAMTCTSPGLPVLSEVLDFVCTKAEVDLFVIVTCSRTL